MGTTEAPGNRLRRRRRFGATALAGVVLAVGLGACGSSAEHPHLSTSEPAFANAFATLLPNLQKTSGTTVNAISNLRKTTDAQVATLFTGLSKQWNTTTKPLLALKPPAPVPTLFAAVTSHLPVVEADLITLAQSAGVHETSTVALCAQHLTSTLTKLTTAVTAVELKLGMTLRGSMPTSGSAREAANRSPEIMTQTDTPAGLGATAVRPRYIELARLGERLHRHALTGNTTINRRTASR